VRARRDLVHIRLAASVGISKCTGILFHESRCDRVRRFIHVQIQFDAATRGISIGATRKISLTLLPKIVRRYGHTEKKYQP